MTAQLFKHWTMKLATGLTATALAFSWLAAPASSAFAAPNAGESNPPVAGTPVPGEGQHDERERLERAYARLVELSGAQATALAHTADRAANVQRLIDMAGENGRDVTALEAALTAYNASVATAQSQHATAAEILDTHAGFNPQGHVTNVDEARTTVQSARAALREAQGTLRQANTTLMQAIRAWRDANPRPTPTPAAPTN